MSLNLSYSFREGVNGLRRARVASIVTITTVAVTLTLLDLFLILTVNVQRIINTLKSQISLEVFIDPTLPATDIESLGRQLSAVVGVSKVTYVSPEQALERFRLDFKEDPLALLGENPLPASFQIVLLPSHRNPAEAESVVQRIQRLASIDEVVYHGQLVRIVDKYSRIVRWIALGLLLLVFTATLFLVSNTLRLTIHAQQRRIQIMKLIGATRHFIRRPYLVQGMLQGGLGGLLCTAIVWITIQLVSLRFPLLLNHVPIFIWGPLGFGLVLGFLGSVLGLKRFLHS
jgi:cell division transport system permease protein